MRLEVNNQGKFAYNILLEKDFSLLKGTLDELSDEKTKICIVTDTNVKRLYCEEVLGIFEGRKVFSFVFEAGEESKNLDTVRKLYKFLIENEFDRKDILLALGGGVVGDLCGYAAATYLRGIDFIQIPTTLLAQVDSSIGGKTGVDFEGYKNMVGAFYLPKAVYINLSTLKTLSEREYSSGMAELIKHGLIKDKTYYEDIISNKEKIKNRDLQIMEEMVYRSDLIKKGVVERDFKENGERALLNFGHTLGHAIEKYFKFELSHGASVALGMLCAADISVERNMLFPEEYEKLKKLLSFFGLPVNLRIEDKDEVLKFTRNDKKVESGSLKFILLDGIGKAVIDRSVSSEDMKKALRSIKVE